MSENPTSPAHEPVTVGELELAVHIPPTVLDLERQAAELEALHATGNELAALCHDYVKTVLDKVAEIEGELPWIARVRDRQKEWSTMVADIADALGESVWRAQTQLDAARRIERDGYLAVLPSNTSNDSTPP